jgi:hypothetical protein
MQKHFTTFPDAQNGQADAAAAEHQQRLAAAAYIQQCRANAGKAGYGPLGTPDAGRAERCAAYERARFEELREAASRHDHQAASRRNYPLPDDAEIRRLRAETRALREELDALRSALPALIEAEVDRVLVDELPEVIKYYLSRRTSGNGEAQPAPR